MPKFRFIVQSPSGKVRKGTISEKDEQSARQSLESAGFSVVSLTESTELIVHTPAAGPAGRPRVKPERAAIIEFEESAGDKAKGFLNTFILRREFAIVLAVLGLVWIVYAWTTRPEKPPDPEEQYATLTFAGSIDNSGFPETRRAIVRIPELPYTETVEFQSDSPPHQVSIVIETTREPQTVEVTLQEGSEKVARGSGTLQPGAEKGQYSFSVSEFQALAEEER